jgi:hypothetical protein
LLLGSRFIFGPYCKLHRICGKYIISDESINQLYFEPKTASENSALITGDYKQKEIRSEFFALAFISMKNQ